MPDLSSYPITKRWPASNPDLLQFYAAPTPNGVKVSIMLEETGLPYEPHFIDISTNEAKDPAFVSLNPNGRIPAIIDPSGPDGEPLGVWESGAILVYLAEKTGRLIPPGQARRYEVLSWVSGLKPAFDRESGMGSLTAGNSSPITDGAAGCWVSNEEGLKRLPDGTPYARIIDYEVSAVDLRTEGLLMAPSYAVPRLLARHHLGFADIALWEIHEAFAAQVLANVAAITDPNWVREKARVSAEMGNFDWDRVNPNGGSVAIGHPFGATGARDLSQAVKELWAMPVGSRGIVSICADGGQGTVALLERI